ncbi:mitochondrial enolase superfamily member 1-like [Amphibalanus amphitrite]|uniref:mitochondrial enolase superfamily member 1-like n=1 Tax=Amphibalanus amphitrite TaxID=1232801 RepID=UPI001C8FD629|nr:mitochondrial enolase superfamily member 1-like [Amphibalanus amphitrite]XP_043229652.1 mitochondrial enolase superfamily member 1-like [Amphibalanus amphitrite]
MEEVPLRITGVQTHDLRFPTSLQLDGSDAVHTDPDYSAALVILETNTELQGHGTTFTIGRGNEIVCECVKALQFLVVGKTLDSIVDNFGKFWDNMVNESQLRWIGPQKGVSHLATAALVNAIWDLWARRERKPVWRLLCDMTPQQLVNVMDFRYISDVLTKEEALDMLTIDPDVQKEREETMLKDGYPAYTTAAGWLGYKDEKIRVLCRQYLDAGWDEFKIKVGQDLADDRRRLQVVRETIGPERNLMVDANQRWDVPEAIYWMKELSEFRPLWIEEPTSPDDILGHAQIAKALAPYGIGVATGEMCQNKVMFKQFLQAGGMQFCQVDSCRLGGINEILPVYLMAHKLNVPVCPHAGGICLNEMVQHLQVFDYVRVSGSTENRRIEYVSHLSEHLETPAVCRGARYFPPQEPGYSCRFRPEALSAFRFPDGTEWKRLIRAGLARNTRAD